MDLKDPLSSDSLVSSLESSITTSSIHSNYRVYSLQQMHMILEKLNLLPVVHNYQKNKPLNIANGCIDMERNESIACQYVSKMVLNTTRPSNQDFQKNFDQLELIVSYANTLLEKLDSSVNKILHNVEKLNEALTTKIPVNKERGPEVPFEENESIQQFYDTSAIKSFLDKCFALNNERNNLQQELNLLEETLKPLQILPSDLNEIKSKMDEANKNIEDLKKHLYKLQH